MSRHRNLHNLTEDDYYDYYDEEDDDDFYYQEQERARKEKEASAKKKKAQSVTATRRLTPKKNQSVNKTGGLIESCKNDIEHKNAVKQDQTCSLKRSEGIKSGVMPPPLGFACPNTTSQANFQQNKLANVITVTESKSLPNQAKDEGTTKSSTTTKSKMSSQLHQRLKTQKSRLSMVVLGHVDAGKSTLMGQVLVQVGIVQNRIVSKYKKEASDIGKASFALAWIMDEDDSERERGVTIDVATKQFSTANHDITILDAPGHADYVPEMISGASSADVGLLVVAATPGEFESGFDCQSQETLESFQHVGQTREHLILSRGLGVSQLIVAVNKLDNSDPPWSEARYLEIENRLTPFLQSNGFDMKRVKFVPLSGLTGINVKDRPSNITLAEWYCGPTLLEAIDNFEPAKRNIDKPLRIIITDIYSEGRGVTIRGRVVQGMVGMDDRIVVLPVGDEATVGRIDHGSSSIKAQTASMINSTKDNLNLERIKFALAGDAVELSIFGIDVARISPGNIISDVDTNLRPKIRKKFKAKVVVMDQLSIPIIRGAQVLLHMHSLDIPAQISKLILKTNKKDGSTIMKPRALTSGANAKVEIKLRTKVCIETFSECRALGRFALRRGGDTVAVGVVEEVLG